jgi:hypothetical protein
MAAVNHFALDAPLITKDQPSDRYQLEIQHLRQQLHESHSMVGTLPLIFMAYLWIQNFLRTLFAAKSQS